MKYGKIENGIVTDVVNGLQPEGYVSIDVKWVPPTEYPIEFYAQGSSEPLCTVVGKGIDENLAFILRSIEQIRSLIHSKNQKKRCLMQLGSFTFNGVKINLDDRDNANKIDNIRTIAGNRIFKVGQYSWIELAPSDIEPLKDALDTHVQPSFDWEKAQYDLVEAMATTDDLNTYWLSM